MKHILEIATDFPFFSFSRRWQLALWSAILIMLLLAQPVLALLILQDDFDPGIDGVLWSALTNASASTSCGSVSGNALYFNGLGTRSAETIDLNVSNGGTISFYIHIGTGSSPCEQADSNEFVKLQYSTNGGTNWTDIQTYNVGSFPSFTLRNETIPAGAQTISTRFRWVQVANSGDTFDNWAIDNVSINAVENQPPVNHVPGGQTPNEDTTLFFSSANGNQIWVSDVDAGSSQVQVALAVNNGSLTLSSVAGLDFSCSGCAGDGTSDSFMIFRGTITAINTALNGLRFDPTANYNGPANLQISTNDLGNTGVGGPGSDVDLVGIIINPINDAPVLTPGAPTLPTITEDDLTNNGQLISTMLGSSVSDVDSGAVEGIAIYSLTSGNGTWQYSINGGATWLPVGTVSTANALLLRDSDRVRFVPNGQNGTSASFSYYAWDRTSGAAGSKVNASSRGGTTAFSTASDTAAIIVTSVNDAPVLDNSGLMSLADIVEDDFTNNGTLVSDIIASAGGDRITDVDPGAVEGLAVFNVDNSHGAWQYSINNGGNWSNFGAPSAVAARLLAADTITRIRFVPNPNYNGTVNPGITFLAWDRTSGSNGGTANVTGSGGITAFSNAIETAFLTVRVLADLELTKSGPATALTGEEITYTLTVTNHGPSDALAVNVTDNAPPGAIVNSVTAVRSGSGPISCLDTVCQTDLMAEDEIIVISIAGTVDPDVTNGTVLLNSANVSSATPDPDSHNNGDTVSTRILVQTDLAITKVDLTDPVGPTQSFLYELTVTNHGPSAAQGVVITDTLDVNTTFSSASAGCNPNNGQVICNVGSLPAGSTARYLIGVVAGDVVSGTILTNAALVSGVFFDPVGSNDATTAQTTVQQQFGPSADVQIAKAVSPDTVAAGEQVTYTLTISNAGPLQATSLLVLDYLPDGVSLIDVAASNPDYPYAFCTLSGICYLGSLSSGHIAAITLVAEVGQEYDGSSLTNIATVTANEVDYYSDNNMASATVNITDTTDLSLTKIALADPIAAGELLMYQFNVTNDGPAMARNVVITDTVPANTTYAGASGSCTESGGLVTCQAADLAAGANMSAWVQVRVDEAVISGTTITNEAYVSAANSPDTSATATTRVVAIPNIDLVLSKTGPITATPGQQIAFTILVTNTGSAVASFVNIEDTLPTGLIFNTINLNRSGIGLLTCTGPICQVNNMAVNEVVTATVTATVDSNLTDGAILVNSAVASSSELDSNAADNSDTCRLAVQPPPIRTGNVYLPIIVRGGTTVNLPDLTGSFHLTPDQASFTTAENVLVTAVVTNVGSAAADGFWVDFYINPSAAPGVNVPWSSVCSLSPCYGLAWYVAGLGPGQSVTLTSQPGSYATDHSRWPGYFAGGTSNLYLYVDSWNPTVSTGGVLESNEDNNQAERHGLTVSGLTVSDEEPLAPEVIPPRPAHLDP